MLDTLRQLLMPSQLEAIKIGVDDIPEIPTSVDKEQAKALLESARAGFARSYASFDAHELKAGRYVTVAGLIVASANVVIVPAVLDVLRKTGITLAAASLVGATSGMVLLGVYAIGQITRVMRVETVPVPATEPAAVLDAYVNQRVELGQVGEAWRLMEITHVMESVNRRRGDLLSRAHESMLVAIAFYVLSIGILFMLTVSGGGPHG